MNNWLVISCSFFYLLLLFGIAYWAERKSQKGKSIINNSYVYSLSLAVYCTAWTFYGSVGRAAVSGIDYVTIYLGPTFIAFLFFTLHRKIIRITKVQRINSIADFISSRYGKNISLAMIVTLFCVIGIIPYIALQIKAISENFDIIVGHRPSLTGNNILNDSTFYIAVGLTIFIILFGTRSVDATEKHEGLVAAIAFESIVKLLAFLTIGIFVTYGVFNGWNDLLEKAAQKEELRNLFLIRGEGAYANWFFLIVLSMLAFLFLPRQFQVGVVENVQEKHLIKASWLFPLYLLLINLFVLPIAIGGKIIFAGSTVNADTYVLALPMHFKNEFITLFTYIGGFSAATSMIIIETIALSTMISNHVVMPLFLSIPRNPYTYDRRIKRFLLNTRRLTIIFIIFLSLGYDKLLAEHYSLVSIGLISFTAVAQFAPAVLGGIFWKGAAKNGAVAGIVVGFSVWFFTLVVPSLAETGLISPTLMERGLFGITALKPYSLLGMKGMDSITHAAFWSLVLNTASFITVSLYSKRSSREVFQAELFVDAFKHSSSPDTNTAWRGTAYLPDLNALLTNFLGKDRSARLLTNYAHRHGIPTDTRRADPRLVAFAEKVLSGVIGSASARIMVSSVAKEEEISIDEVLNILRESQQIIELNRELRRKSQDLVRATEQLTQANKALKDIDELKDEFLYTVTHELRTPLTSIRALSEIVHDNADLEEGQRQYYLSAIIRETERLSHLISQVLNLERYESGRQKLNLSEVDLRLLIEGVAESMPPLAKEQNTSLTCLLPEENVTICGDEDLLRQVLLNLLSNAFKFADAAEGKIQVAVHLESKHVRVEVTDNGRGIPTELHEQIFDKFFQAKNQTLKKPQGTGLGLAICKKIVEMHQGRIWVESEPGWGSHFIFTLPTNQQDE